MRPAMWRPVPFLVRRPARGCRRAVGATAIVGERDVAVGCIALRTSGRTETLTPLRPLGLPPAAMPEQHGVAAGSTTTRRWTAFAPLLRSPTGAGTGRRGFSTAAFTVPAQGDAPEQALFVVGLNEGKFFGQDGAEEGLKLLERIADHDPKYHLLFGLTDTELREMEEEFKVEKRKLTPSRELEKERNCEFIPLMQAGMVDNRPRLAIGRALRTTQAHVAWRLWKQPREAVKLYWAFWRRKKYKDAERCSFWSKHFPLSARAYFEDRADLVAIRAVEHLVARRLQGQQGTALVIVNNELFSAVVNRLGLFLDKDAANKLGSPELSRQLRDHAGELCADVPDLTSLLVFVYIGIPLLLLQQGYLALEYFVTVPRDGEIAYDLDQARE